MEPHTSSDPSLTPRSPHDLGPTDIVWSHFSRPRTDDVVGRIEAAAAAGYDAIGLYTARYESARDEPGALEAIDDALDRTGLMIAEIEVMQGWAAGDGAPDERSTAMEQTVVEMAQRWGCRYVQAISMHTCTTEQATKAFGQLCDRLGEHGLLVGIEWVPFTSIKTAADAQRIVESADRPNGGYCVDSWHLTRSTNDLEDIRRLDGSKVLAVQLNDGTVTPELPDDYYTDCLSYRTPPGQGEFDLVDLVKVLDEIGSTAPLSLEVPSTTLWEMPIGDAAAASITGLRQILTQARPT